MEPTNCSYHLSFVLNESFSVRLVLFVAVENGSNEGSEGADLQHLCARDVSPQHCTEQRLLLLLILVMHERSQLAFVGASLE